VEGPSVARSPAESRAAALPRDVAAHSFQLAEERVEFVSRDRRLSRDRFLVNVTVHGNGRYRRFRTFSFLDGDGMTRDISPAARALVALELIQNNPGITAQRLADRLGVTERAARRYVATLREADLPIESVCGPYH